MRDFAAIDFETANEQPSSVCSVGVVVVRNPRIIAYVIDMLYICTHNNNNVYEYRSINK